MAGRARETLQRKESPGWPRGEPVFREPNDPGIVGVTTMSDAPFTHDVFLGHRAKDKAVVRAAAERLRKDGLPVRLGGCEIKPEVPLAHRMGAGQE